MNFTSEQILLIIAAVGVVVVNIINAWRTNTKVALVDAKTDAVVKSTVENTEVTLATKKTVDRVETQTNGHLSVMTTNVQNLEAKLEMALKQNELALEKNTDLQHTNADIVAMMKTLLEAEANDKKDLMRSIEKNGTRGEGYADSKLDMIQKTTTEILLKQSAAKLADGGQLDEMHATGEDSNEMLRDQAETAKKKTT